MKLALVLLLLVPSIALAKSSSKPNRGAAPPLAAVRRSGELMGAPSTALVEGRADSANTARALDAVWDDAALLGDALSPWQPRTELSRLNERAGGERFACSTGLYDAIDAALLYAEETGGAYDPTIEPLSRAWDVYGQGRVPAPEEIATARRLVGWREVARDPANRTVRFTRAGVGLDLGGIARGYALDRMAAGLREHGIARALVDLGGGILALSNREPWQTEVTVPGDPGTTAFRIALTNAALSTAAQVERGVSADGVRRGSILDPGTGMPVRTGATVSVVASSAARAEAVAAALLVMGRERAAAFVTTHSGLGALWLEAGGDGLHAWAWNLPALYADPGVRVVWMTPR